MPIKLIKAIPAAPPQMAYATLISMVLSACAKKKKHAI